MKANARSRWLCLGLLGWLASPASGCSIAPNVVLMDQKTALEQQAAGEYRALENDLQQAGMAPKGEDIAGEVLEAANADQNQSTLGEVVQLYSAVRTDSEWIDQLLVAGCIGEGLDGLLQQTPDTCTEDLDIAQLTRVLERTNLHRRQLWIMLHKRQPETAMERVRDIWRDIHLQRVVCGGLIQINGQTWEKKPC